MDNSAVAIGNPAAAEWVPVAALTVWDQNPKPHDASNLKEIARSIRRFDFGAPIVAWKSQQRVVAGHGRLLAAQLLLSEDPGRLLATDAPGPGLVPVRWVEFASEQEAAAYALADNRLTEVNPMDEGQVAAILASFDGPVEIPGYDEEALSALLAMNEPEAPDEPEGDLTPPEEPQSRVGEVYVLGPHRLVCGDAIQAAIWDLLLEGQPYDELVTDPPYGVSYAAKNDFLNSYDKGNSNQTPIENDERPPLEMKQFWVDVLSLACAYAKAGATYYSTGPQGGDLLLLLLALQESGWLLKHMLIWVKNNHVLGRCDFHYKHEPILYGWKPGAGHYFSSEPGECFSTWEVDKPNQSKEHPTMKPVPLFSKAIEHGSRRGEVVVDPFGGSGTTLIACAQTGRRCRMIELDPRYCDVIRKRWGRYALEAGLDPGPGALP